MKMYSSPFMFGGSAGFAGFGGATFADAEEIQYRLSGAMEVRSTESIAQVLSRVEAGDCIRLAPDTWSYDAPMVINKSCAIVGSPLGTRIRRGNGLKSGPLVSVQADNVVLSNIYFEDLTQLADCVAISAVGVKNLYLHQCAIMNFSVGIENTGGNLHQYVSNDIIASSIGIRVVGDCAGHRIHGNVIAMNPNTNLSIDLGSDVTSTSVVGNVTSLKPGSNQIRFYNTGVAQTFSSVGGNGNHVSGNVAALQEIT